MEYFLETKINRRSLRKWSKKIITWEDDLCRYYSIVFTWDLFEWSQQIQPELSGKKIVVGGPAVQLMPELVPDWIEFGGDIPALHRHNPDATRTSTGCIRRCAFCAVPEMEGDLKELSEWEVKPMIIDNNLLACSRKHFDRVIDKLKLLTWCDFNQGLDIRLLSNHHARAFTNLRNPIIRLSFDVMNLECYLRWAIDKLLRVCIPKKQIRVYVLIGFRDTPEDALYRLNVIKELGLKPFAMRYQPLNAKIKNEYVAPGWTNKELIKFMSYWTNFRHVAGIPFNEFIPHKKNKIGENLLEENK